MQRDVIVESTCLRELEVFGKLPIDVRMIENDGTWSARSDLFRDVPRSKSQREDSTACEIVG